jgi:hypothetical protein
VIEIGSLVRPRRDHYTSIGQTSPEVCVLWRETPHERSSGRDLVAVPWDSLGIVVGIRGGIVIVNFSVGLLRATRSGLEVAS